MNLLDGPCFCVKDAKDKVFNGEAGKHPYIYIYKRGVTEKKLQLRQSKVHKEYTKGVKQKEQKKKDVEPSPMYFKPNQLTKSIKGIDISPIPCLMHSKKLHIKRILVIFLNFLHFQMSSHFSYAE